MAIHTLLYVLNNSKAKKSHRLVLIEIANHTNSDGLAWPSYQRLANRTGLVRHWVIKIVADLAAVGELEIVPHASPTGSHAYRTKRVTTSFTPVRSEADLVWETSA